MKTSALLVFGQGLMMMFALSVDTCTQVPIPRREDCVTNGKGISQKGCEQRRPECCWQPVDESGVPWCHKRAPGPISKLSSL